MGDLQVAIVFVIFYVGCWEDYGNAKRAFLGPSGFDGDDPATPGVSIAAETQRGADESDKFTMRIAAIRLSKKINKVCNVVQYVVY